MRRHILPILALGIPAGAFSFNLDGNRWVNGESTFFVDVTGQAPSGVTWSQAFEEAMDQWTNQTDFTFTLEPVYLDPCTGFSASSDGEFPDGEGDGLNGADFKDDVCGNEFGSGVLATTLSIALPGNLGFALIDQTDILFNNSFNWDVYSGARRPEIDFRRVALHELGHAVGLGHEETEVAIMAPSLSDIDVLQPDDIAGANALYGGPGDCAIVDLSVNSVIEDALDGNDCAVLELYGGGEDTSFVDTYRLTLEEDTYLNIVMESASLDSVLIVTDNRLNGIDFDDDATGNCDALINSAFPAGEYLLLANTYAEPFKCNGNTGRYKISVSDNVLPILTDARSATGSPTRSIFHGGATSDGMSYKTSFSASEAISASASIQADPAHHGEAATFYSVAILSSGQIFAGDGFGKYKQIPKLSSIPAFRQTSSLQPEEGIALLNGFRGEDFGLTDLGISFYVGYSLDRDPGEIYFNGKPIRVTIN